MDRDLVERAMSGDHDAFSELVRVAAGRLLVTVRLARTAPEADKGRRIEAIRAAQATFTEGASTPDLVEAGELLGSRPGAVHHVA